MKIKILQQIPVQEQFRPTVGKSYEVVEYNFEKGLAFIDVNGTKVGIFTDRRRGECEVVEYD